MRTIEELDPTVRTYCCLKRAGINFVEELLGMTDDEIKSIRNLGKRSYEEIKELLGGLK